MSFQQRALHRLSRYFPRLFWLQYARQARQMGFDRLYFILSFDCDSPEDAEAAEQLAPWLRERGIKVTYAVPGAQLEQHSAIYQRLAKEGADFINHGGLPHTEWRDGRYWSITFYHEMAPEEVAEDIRRGHRIVEKVIGKTPMGFRAPHFGLCQKRKQLGLLHTTLKELGYCYSTSSMPMWAFQHGPIVDFGGIVEIPLSGTYSNPLNVLDSWSYVISPYTPVISEEYSALVAGTIDYLQALRVPGVLNYYVDPSHVCNSDSFFRAIEYIIRHQVQALYYSDLTRMLKRSS